MFHSWTSTSPSPNLESLEISPSKQSRKGDPLGSSRTNDPSNTTGAQAVELAKMGSLFLQVAPGF